MRNKSASEILPKDAHRPLEVHHTVEGEHGGAVLGRAAVRPVVTAAVTINKFTNILGELEIQGLVEALEQEAQRTVKGDLTRAEAMLTAQAHTLDAIFNRLAIRGAANMGEHLDAADKFLRLALKAQSQCRATLETLAAIKNPPVVFARQANIANGPQQVNNGFDPRARENEKEQSKQSGEFNELLQDTRASQTQGGINTPLEAVGEINGAEVRGREGKGIAERIQGRVARHPAKGGRAVKAVG